MKTRIQTIFILILFLSGANLVKAQDIHFSQFNASPLTLNPALTGVNKCNYRFALNYKNQWGNVAPYNTFAASYDMNINKKSKGNYGGIGASAFVDRAGDTKFTTANFKLTGSYSLMLSSDGSQFITTGLEAGVIQNSFDYSEMTFDSQFGPDGFNENAGTRETFESTKKIVADVGAGMLYNYTQKQTNIYAGAAFTHLNQPNQSFRNDLDEKLHMKFTFHGGGQFPINDQFFIQPRYMFLKQGPHMELNAGSMFKFKKSRVPSDKTAFYVGGWYRLKDAVILSARMDIGSFNVGVSYDINVSKLTRATNARGGPELSLTYTGCLGDNKGAVYCPFL